MGDSMEAVRKLKLVISTLALCALFGCMEEESSEKQQVFEAVLVANRTESPVYIKFSVDGQSSNVVVDAKGALRIPKSTKDGDFYLIGFGSEGTIGNATLSIERRNGRVDGYWSFSATGGGGLIGSGEDVTEHIVFEGSRLRFDELGLGSTSTGGG